VEGSITIRHIHGKAVSTVALSTSSHPVVNNATRA
jgi:hypothetical protein